MRRWYRKRGGRWSVFVLLLLPNALTAQSDSQKRQWMYLQYRQLHHYIRGGSVEPHWTGEGERFWYVDDADAGPTAYLVDPRRPSRRALFELGPLREGLRRFVGADVPESGVPFADLELDADDEDRIQLTVGDRRIEYGAGSGALRVLGEALRVSARPRPGEALSPDGAWAARISDHNVWLRSVRDGRDVALTRDGTEDQPWGGPFQPQLLWSPDGARLAVLREDLRAVPTVPIVKYLTDRPEVERKHRWEAAGPFERMELVVMDVNARTETRALPDPEPEAPDRHKYLMGWTPDGSEVVLASAAPDYRSLRVLAADAETGAVRSLLGERRQTFVHTQPYRPPRVTFLAEGDQFVWKSDRDGWHHLYLYGTDGTLVGRLTTGSFDVVDILTVDEERGWVYFTAHLDRAHPYDTHVARVSLGGGELQQLTEGRGIHNAVFSPEMGFFVDTYQNVDLLPVVELRTAAGALIDTLSLAEIDAPEGFVRVDPEEFTVKAADGQTDLYGVMYKPFDFDPDAVYPVVEIMVGRPTVAANELARTHSLGGEALAQLGFVVVVLDARGTPERGHEFHATVYGQMGRYEIPDHAAALRQLFHERPYLDGSRVGALGVSYGGYYAIRALLQAPDLYRVAVAVAPYDPRGDAVLPYMGLPLDNPDGYSFASNIRLADQLEGDLLIQHGSADDGALLAWTMQLVQAFVQSGKPVDLQVYPDQGHGLVGASASYAEEARIRHLREHLQGGG